MIIVMYIIINKYHYFYLKKLNYPISEKHMKKNVTKNVFCLKTNNFRQDGKSLK